ncbi:hypothetical protein O5478_17700 [Escherichia coli]|nr:hypothetical protein [Escherichia coli]
MAVSWRVLASAVVSGLAAALALLAREEAYLPNRHASAVAPVVGAADCHYSARVIVISPVRLMISLMVNTLAR